VSELKVFIGFDPRQPVAFQVCAQSIWEHASKPISITRLDLRTLPFTRSGLTSFTFSRFLVPYLSGFEGQSLFMDPDILVRGDIVELFDKAKGTTAFNWDVAMVMHEDPRKFERASVMLFNNSKLRHMDPAFGMTHRMFDFAWSEDQLPLDKEWNHLVGYDAPNPDAKIVHFTMGLPIWEETKGCEFAKEWWDTYKRMNSSVSFAELMGRSVHVPHLEKLKANA